MPAKEQIEIGVYINFQQQTKLQNRLLNQLQVQQNKSQILGFLLVMEVAIVKELKKLVKPVI